LWKHRVDMREKSTARNETDTDVLKDIG